MSKIIGKNISNYQIVKSNTHCKEVNEMLGVMTVLRLWRSCFCGISMLSKQRGITQKNRKVSYDHHDDPWVKFCNVTQWRNSRANSFRDIVKLRVGIREKIYPFKTPLIPTEIDN